MKKLLNKQIEKQTHQIEKQEQDLEQKDQQIEKQTQQIEQKDHELQKQELYTNKLKDIVITMKARQKIKSFTLPPQKLMPNKIVLK